MLKLKLDWCNEHVLVPEGVDPDEPLLRVEVVREVGPSGWPEIAVYVASEQGEPAHMPAMRLYGWLQGVYGLSDEEADELAEMAVEV